MGHKRFPKRRRSAMKAKRRAKRTKKHTPHNNREKAYGVLLAGDVPEGMPG